MTPPPFDADTLAAHVEGLHRLARSLVRQDANAEDLVQETFGAVAAGAAPTRGGHPAGWLRAVLRRIAWNRARAGRRRQRHEQAAAAERPLPIEPAADDAADRVGPPSALSPARQAAGGGFRAASAGKAFRLCFPRLGVVVPASA